MPASDAPLRIVHLTGSPVSERWAELSRLYARGALDALGAAEPSVDGRWEHVVVDVGPDGSWRFPSSLASEDLAAAAPVDRTDGIAGLAALDADVGVPQMFCPPGLTDHRSLLSLLGVPSIGNPAAVMAVTADKSLTRAVVAAAGVAVPAATLLRPGDAPPPLSGPVVVKPVDADNSTGVRLVDDSEGLRDAIDAALELSHAVLVEDFVPLGREVRCGTVLRRGELLALPLEEYAVDPVAKPIRGESDKLASDDDGLRLVAKDDEHAWIVSHDDPAVDAVQRLARTAHTALGCRHHGLVDVRIDPDGRPWFLESGPYCSFAPSSVVVMMARAAGIGLDELFTDAVDVALDRSTVGGVAEGSRR
ncbi:MAG: D-alanine--D-alanine ligase [Actinomycetota bacterium]